MQDDNRFVLSRVVNFEGKEYSELNLDFDALTGNDVIQAERQLVAMNQHNSVIPVKELSKEFLAVILAKAAKVPVELINSLSAKDFSKATVLAQNFLLR